MKLENSTSWEKWKNNLMQLIPLKNKKRKEKKKKNSSTLIIKLKIV